ncbi:unnamed protein product (macronuclear) [Paramecium tetraurelia]|uniref:Uncharacterized protein n=1 Tax=Paramecium tetraurelia TaxID=5888 RepID=A0BSX5_PARTE|nr:uncharacterized protein GSPATT00031874001 [Paramecium tetraurelia]CAK61642.1 unnamed protein product [Paramecium tetraurelia]|eukprot:XP_001429040.1 hypothetical protein (macronuclear) [Paramecium tetraurelia strain d4-2]
MRELEYRAYEVYSGNILVDYWSNKQNDHSYPKIEMKKINKKMSKLQIKGLKRKKKMSDQIIEQITDLCI